MTGTKESNVYLASKPRYEILDGLRGVAAVFVLVYHLCETHFGLGAAYPLNHGYLAVDFFFALSGFVMGYAYDGRWDRMTTWGFFKRRLIRLHPMVICGSVIGALLFYFQQCDAFPGIAQSPWWLVVLAMLWSFTMIPVPKGLEVRGQGETNPLNGPIWSLQWEYLANILYALIIRRLSTWLLELTCQLLSATEATFCFIVAVLLFLYLSLYGLIFSWLRLCLLTSIAVCAVFCNPSSFSRSPRVWLQPVLLSGISIILTASVLMADWMISFTSSVLPGLLRESVLLAETSCIASFTG